MFSPRYGCINFPSCELAQDAESRTSLTETRWTIAALARGSVFAVLYLICASDPHDEHFLTIICNFDLPHCTLYIILKTLQTSPELYPGITKQHFRLIGFILPITLLRSPAQECAKAALHYCGEVSQAAQVLIDR